MAPRTRRQSAFQEIEVADAAANTLSSTVARKERPQSVRFRSRDEVHLVERYEESIADNNEDVVSPRGSKITQYISLENSPLPNSWSSWMMYRFGAILVVFAALVPLLHATELFGLGAAIPIRGAEAAALPEQAWSRGPVELQKRADSPTDACFRWAQQCE